MKLIGTTLTVLFVLVGIAPTDVVAQQQITPFEQEHVNEGAELLQVGPKASDYESVVASETRSSGLLLGGLIGVIAGVGIGYLVSKDSTAGCDDGICAWVIPTMVGGATGLVIGSWLGYRVGLGSSTK